MRSNSAVGSPESSNPGAISVSVADLLGAMYSVTDVQTAAVALAFPTPLTDSARSEKSFNVTALLPERKAAGAEARI
jgi:hypothetical protein